MARRRMMSQELNGDEDFNSLSIEAQLLFLRMLSVSDDCGVVPATLFTLRHLVNPPDKISKNLPAFLDEIVAARLGHLFIYDAKPFFAFKQGPFEQYQGHVLNKRTRSEYLRLTVLEFQELSQTFPDFLGKGFLELVQGNKEESSKKKEESTGTTDKPGTTNPPPPKLTAKEIQAQAEQIYQAYPLKVDKQDALRAIAKALKTKSFDYLLERTQLYARIRDGDKEFMPHPATWFNRQRYDQDPETWTRNPSNGTTRQTTTTNGSAHQSATPGTRLDVYNVDK